MLNSQYLKLENSPLVSGRARGAYLAAECRHDVSYGFARLSQFTDTIEQHFEDFDKLV